LPNVRLPSTGLAAQDGMGLVESSGAAAAATRPLAIACSALAAASRRRYASSCAITTAPSSGEVEFIATAALATMPTALTGANPGDGDKNGGRGVAAPASSRRPAPAAVTTNAGADPAAVAAARGMMAAASPSALTGSCSGTAATAPLCASSHQGIVTRADRMPLPASGEEGPGRRSTTLAASATARTRGASSAVPPAAHTAGSGAPDTANSRVTARAKSGRAAWWVGKGVGDGDEEADALREDEAEACAEAAALPDCEAERVAEGEAAALRLGDRDPEAEGDGEGEAERLADGEAVAERELDPLAVSELLPVGVPEPVDVADELGELLGDAPTLCVALGEPDRELVADTVAVGVCRQEVVGRKRARVWIGETLAPPDSHSPHCPPAQIQDTHQRAARCERAAGRRRAGAAA